MIKPDLAVPIASRYGQPMLAGSKNGEAFFPKLLSETAGRAAGSVVAFDFSGIELVTASFFRTAFRAFRDYARKIAELYPVFVNANEQTLEEITPFAEDVGDVFIFAKLTKNGEIQSAILVGRLDEKQARTLNALADLGGESDAGTLLERFPETPSISAAAWSNRLAALAGKGLVLERLEGRIKKYKLITKDLRYGARVHT